MNNHNWTDFEKYLIDRIDRIEEKLSKHSGKITRNTVIISAAIGVLSAGITLIRSL